MEKAESRRCLSCGFHFERIVRGDVCNSCMNRIKAGMPVVKNPNCGIDRTSAP